MPSALKITLYSVCTAGLISQAVAGGPDEMMPPPAETRFVGDTSLYYSYMRINTPVTATLPGGSTFNLPRLPGQLNGLGFYAGFRYGRYYGMGIGYEYYSKVVRTTTSRVLSETFVNSVSTRPTIAYLVARGYYPIERVIGLSIVGEAGAGINDFSYTDNVDNVGVDGRNVLVNLRMGLGLDYVFARTWAIHGIYHYTPNHTNFRIIGGWKESWSVDLGFDYLIT